MDKDNTKKLLLSLLSERQKRTKISQIREIFDEIETALSGGISRATVVEKLNEAGIDIGLNSFVSALHIIRKEKNLIKKTNRQPPKIEPVEDKEITPENIISPGKQIPISEIKNQPVDIAGLARSFKKLPKEEKQDGSK